MNKDVMQICRCILLVAYDASVGVNVLSGLSLCVFNGLQC